MKTGLQSLAGVTSSEPHCKNLVVPCHPPQFNDVSKESSTYVSVSPSLTIPLRGPPGIHTFSLPWGRVFVQISLAGGRGFELEKIPTVLKEKCIKMKEINRELSKEK